LYNINFLWQIKEKPVSCALIYAYYNKQHVTLLVFLDLSAAFDTVDHDILLRRLKYKFGICNNALAWFRSYLVNRSHRVVIENVMSDSFDMKYGVPQGSCLGPLLFIICPSCIALLTI
jgi:hypothetical protein